MELSEYTVGSLRKLRGKRNASTETGICAELVNTVLPVQEVVATTSYIPGTSVVVIRKCVTSMRKETEMRLKPVVKASEFEKYGFKPCRGLPKSAESYYLCVKNGHRVMFVDSKHFTESEWPIKDARIHRNANCRYSDKRTATEIECELVVNGLLKEVEI